MTPSAIRDAVADFDTQRSVRLSERYRDPLDLPVAWNETLDVLIRHRSVRSPHPWVAPAQ